MLKQTELGLRKHVSVLTLRIGHCEPHYHPDRKEGKKSQGMAHPLLTCPDRKDQALFTYSGGALADPCN